ncbi:MAG: hypothetical protein R3199_05070 [Gemmatimonadota bacterium]|nr:hypothetical protein [Gemmatimonadota bacterium]
MIRLLLVALIGAASLPAVPAIAQEEEPGVWYSLAASDSILSTPDAGVSLESFHGEVVTGVYLRGVFRGQEESVAYGIDANGWHYVWFSVWGRDSTEYLPMLYDVDTDLVPEYLLFRSIDWNARVERTIEFRDPGIADEPIEIQIQPACTPPRCDPDTWERPARERVEVPSAFFEPWRSVFALAATRGERWLGEPKAIFLAEPEGAESAEDGSEESGSAPER